VLTMTHPPTPTLSFHARLRCGQMDVRTRRVKTIMRDPDMTYDAGHGARMAWRRDDPTILVVYVEEAGKRHAVTVLPRTYERYHR
jgi:hypothetical protein